MTKYIVWSKETVYYMQTVEAESAAEAKKMVIDTGESGEAVDGEDFQIIDVESIEE